MGYARKGKLTQYRRTQAVILGRAGIDGGSVKETRVCFTFYQGVLICGFIGVLE
jgi:hypothetical protein